MLVQDKGIVFKPDFSCGIKCFGDANFSGNLNVVDSEDPQNVSSRTGQPGVYVELQGYRSLSSIRNTAKKLNIDTNITKRIWKNMIWSYINYERKNFKKKR